MCANVITLFCNRTVVGRTARAGPGHRGTRASSSSSATTRRRLRLHGLLRCPLRHRAGVVYVPQGAGRSRSRPGAAAHRARATRCRRRACSNFPLNPDRCGDGGPHDCRPWVGGAAGAVAQAAVQRDEIWCQLFSEPDAGSDFAAVAPRRPSATATTGSSTVRRCGRRWPTSHGGACSWRAPTPSAAKHQGLTYLPRRHARAWSRQYVRCVR